MNLLETTDVFASENPVIKNEIGFPVLTLNVDKRNYDLYQEFYIRGATLDEANVNSVLKGIVAVCGDRFAFTTEDS